MLIRESAARLIEVRLAEAYAAHGYCGIEAEAVDRIADFITANSKHGP